MRVGCLGGLFALLGTSAIGADISWPPLPESGFVTGRLATEADIRHGDAVFLATIDGKANGTPARIQVPQYALLNQEKGGRQPVVVVQAETNERGTFLGMRDAAGHEYVATIAEVTLLGPNHP
jgi:hypothetical protein